MAGFKPFIVFGVFFIFMLVKSEGSHDGSERKENSVSSSIPTDRDNLIQKRNPREIDSIERAVYIPTGQTRILTCTAAHGIWNAKIKWYYKPNPETVQYLVEEEDSDEIHAISPKQNYFAVYMCEVHEPYNAIRTIIPVYSDVIRAERIDSKEHMLNVPVGEWRKLTCLAADGIKNPKIKWFFQASPESRVTKLAKGKNSRQLHLYMDDQSHTGFYWCEVQRPGNSLQMLKSYIKVVSIDEISDGMFDQPQELALDFHWFDFFLFFKVRQ